MEWLFLILGGFFIFAIGVHQGAKEGNNECNRALFLLEEQKKISDSIEKEKALIKKQQQSLENELIKIKEKEANFNKEKKLFNDLYKMKVNQFPMLGKMLADINNQKDNLKAEYLIFKSHPARNAANTVKEVNKKNKILFQQNKEYEYKLQYYETLIPQLADNDDFVFKDNQNTYNINSHFSDDKASYWLSNTEYSTLSSAEKYQLALDRYFNRKKTNVELGRDYEQYIGYLYEENGYTVSYQGITKGLNDLGRDLICTKNGITHIVQCKYWSSKKIIHEKHINQLFGTTVEYYLKNTNKTISDFAKDLSKDIIKPIFITSTTYSETALAFAKSLNVTCISNKKLQLYPLIKCNINKTTGEKIYHLPFDQQYNTVKINSPGECRVLTVKEAEEKGFRRALRWHGNNNLQN